MTHFRTHRRRLRGFTLIELMVALTVGSLAVSTFYSIARHTTRFFQEQGRVANTQDGLRMAMRQVKADLKRAGNMAARNINTALPERVCRPASPALVGGGLTFGAILAHNRNTPDPVASGIDPSNLYGGHPDVRVDRLALLGNYESDAWYSQDSDSFTPNTVTLTNSESLRRDIGSWHTGAPATLDVASLNAIFRVGRPLMIQGPNTLRHYATITGITSANFGAGGGIQLTFNPGAFDAGGTPCALSNGTAAPLQGLEYTVVPAAAAGTAAGLTNTGLLIDNIDEMLPQLHRREIQVTTGAPLPGGEDRTLLDYVVAFHVDFIVDSGTAINTDPDIIDWVAEAGAAQAQATANPETVRGARIVLAARSPGHDRSLGQDLAQPLRVFQINGARRGAARVRTLRADVFLPNLAMP